MKKILEISNLSHSYGNEILTIKDFSFSLKDGEIASIIGAMDCSRVYFLVSEKIYGNLGLWYF